MREPTLYEMMRRLIGSPSVSSVSPAWDQSNAQVIDLLADWCEARGFAVERLPIADHPGKFNLVASAGSGPEGLVLSGHTDTVPFDEKRWSSDPFRLTERDDRWYGLGSCDMKGFFAVVLDAIRDLDTTRLRHPLMDLRPPAPRSTATQRALSSTRVPASRERSLSRSTITCCWVRKARISRFRASSLRSRA